MSYPVYIYGNTNYSGTNAPVAYGQYTDIETFGIGLNTNISIKIAPFTTVTLYDSTSFKGNSIAISGPKNIPDFSQYTAYLNGVSSLTVTQVVPPISAQLACCQGTTPSYNCTPYLPGSPQCANTMVQYCSQAANISDPICQTYCRSNSAVCDNAVIAYCKTNPSDPYCACINSPVNVNGQVNPKCIDAKCVQSGYLTTSMQQTACPSVINCDIQTTLANSGITLASGVPIEQNCGSTGTTTSSQTIAPTTTSSPTIGTFLTQNIVWIFFLFVFLALIMGAFPQMFDDSQLNSTELFE